MNDSLVQEARIKEGRGTSRDDFPEGDQKKLEKKKDKQKKKKLETKKRKADDENSELEDAENDKLEINESSKRRRISDINGTYERNDDDGEDDDDEDELLAAAALWAKEDESDNEGSNDDSRKAKTALELKRNDLEDNPTTTISTPNFDNNSQLQYIDKTYSLHLTQLPYDCTEYDIHKLLVENCGCSPTSIRLVYDRDTQGRKTVFRGVAFVDLGDEQSYIAALKFNHKIRIRGRKINIRPTKTKQELANIVSETQQRLQEKIQSGRATEREVTVSSKQVNKRPRRDDNKLQTSQKAKKAKKDKKDYKASDKKEKKGKKVPRAVDAKGNPIKLTKKERNRRAAIIMSLKGKKKKKKKKGGNKQKTKS